MAGCATPVQPADLLTLAPSANADRQMQTRRFDEVTEAELLAASVAVLQDLGFQLRISQAQLGLIVGNKARTLDDMMREAFTFPPPDPVPRPATVEVVVATRPAAAGNARRYYVRVMILLVRRDYVHGYMTWAEELKDPALYQRFFELLSKNLAREAHGVAWTLSPGPVARHSAPEVPIFLPISSTVPGRI